MFTALGIILFANRCNYLQVQIKTRVCSGTVRCNCGVAVAAGRDVFVVNKCNPNGPWDIGFKRCDDKILTDNILIRGSVYTVCCLT